MAPKMGRGDAKPLTPYPLPIRQVKCFPQACGPLPCGKRDVATVAKRPRYDAETEVPAASPEAGASVPTERRASHNTGNARRRRAPHTTIISSAGHVRPATALDLRRPNPSHVGPSATHCESQLVSITGVAHMDDGHLLSVVFQHSPYSVVVLFAFVGDFALAGLSSA